jgi:phosphoadenosine phosphosulfate reductase
MDHADLAAWAGALENRPPQEVLAFAAERFAPRLAFATGFGAEGCVLVDMAARAGLAVDVFTLDTGYLFPETYTLWNRLEERYGITIRGVRPWFDAPAEASPDGRASWEVDPEACCRARKVEPLAAELARFDAWITAIRSDQTKERASARPLEWDAKFGLVKVNPLLRWSADDVARYVREHDVPVNPLHARGYPSIGCAPCTTPVGPGEDPRAGRWRGSARKECGLHVLATATATPNPTLSPLRGARENEGDTPNPTPVVPGA